jgi:O-methyltransferase involved in polyketide biosynthesis
MAAHRRRTDRLRHRGDARPPQLTRKNGNVGMDAPLTKVELTGVPEAALWNLYQRASAARAGHVDDPRAVEVLARPEYPFERFATPFHGLAARLHALRVRTVDTAVRRVLAGAPDATVVALGEGFETQFWRVDDGRLRWLTFNLPRLWRYAARCYPTALATGR